MARLIKVRLWSLHPKYLDPPGLNALWREALLAQAVLRGRTRGYRSHPQLERFTRYLSPLEAIALYLAWVAVVAHGRGYRYNETLYDKLLALRCQQSVPVTTGQLRYEQDHLRIKLQQRNPQWVVKLPDAVEPHPMFQALPDNRVEKWERPSQSAAQTFS